MARVFFPDRLQRFTDGIVELDLQTDTYRDLETLLSRRFPGILEVITNEMMVAIDEEIVAEPFLESLGLNTEVRFIYRINGG